MEKKKKNKQTKQKQKAFKITFGYTIFLVIGSFKLLSQIAFIFQTDVTREAATYS